MPEITFKSEPVQGSIMENEIADPMLTSYFQLNPNDIPKTDIKLLNEIKGYLKGQSEDGFEQAKILRDIKHRLGAVPLGKSEIQHIHQYIRLRQAMAEVEEQVKEMEQ